MPDIVKDTVKLSADDEKNQFSNIKVESFVVDSRKNLRNSRCCSTESLDLVSTFATRYIHLFLFFFFSIYPLLYSTGKCKSRIEVLSSKNYTKLSSILFRSLIYTSRYLSFKANEEDNPPSSNETYFTQRRTHKFYNTISDPTRPWFRQNGLPASKALREDHISLYCQDLNLGLELSQHFLINNGNLQTNNNFTCNFSDEEKSTPKQVECLKSTSTGRKRPTNIDLNLKDSSKAIARKSNDLSLPPMKGFTGMLVFNVVFFLAEIIFGFEFSL